jgi:tripartite-type tricarboxylate transporter receptor subunit TctC
MRIPVLICGVVFLLGPAQMTLAQEYPTRTIRMVVPTLAGGSADILARLVAERLRGSLGQAVIVDNRPGAGQMIGSEYVARSAPDGYTIMLTTGTYTTSVAINRKLAFDPLNDITGVTRVGVGPLMLTVHPSLPVKSVKDLIALARKRPGELHYGTAGTGSMIHFATEVFASSAKIDIVHVPYKSGAPAVTDAIGGHTQMIINSMPSVWPHVKAKRLRALAVTTPNRTSFIPELPTIAESGVPGFEAVQWWGVLAPGKTPAPIITRLHDEINKILTSAEMKGRLAEQGAELVLMSPQEFSAFVASEIAKWRKVAEARNLVR